MSKRERKIDLSGAQIMAGVLATLTAAIATSYVSRLGTLIAAAAVSIISTAGTAIYRYYISRTSEKLRSAAPIVRQRAYMYGAGLAAGRMPGAVPGNRRARSRRGRLPLPGTDPRGRAVGETRRRRSFPRSATAAAGPVAPG